MLSQTIEYALRSMVHLGALEPGVSLNSEAIARHTQVPQGYLSKILRDLVVAGLVISQRGPNGGFCIARPAASISMLDVVNAVDPFKRIRSCPLGRPDHVTLCPLHHRLDRAADLLEREFRETSLAEVLESGKLPGAGCAAMLTPSIRGVKT